MCAESVVELLSLAQTGRVTNPKYVGPGLGLINYSLQREFHIVKLSADV